MKKLTSTFLVIIFLILGCLEHSSLSYAKSNEAQSSNNSNTYAHYMMGIIYDRQGELQKAIEEYKQALEYATDKALIYIKIGRNYLKLNKIDEAKSYINKAIKLRPEDIETHSLLALLYTKESEYGKAASEYKKVIEINPENKIALASLADLYVLEGKNKQAIEIYKELIKKANNIREVTDKTVYDIGRVFKKLLKKQLPHSLKKYYKFIRFNEIRNMNFPDIKELKKREDGFIFYKDKVYTSISKDKFGKINNMWFNDEKVRKDVKIIRGQVGFKGRVRGVVRIIYQEEQMKYMKNNEILVSPMTTPNLLPAIKKAKAIVTDEGGITCHAAIVARELGKPCIIGTKIATQVLKDGDFVEVDGDLGVVKLI